MKSAPSNVCTRVIEDIDAMAAAIADGLEAEHVQLEAKRFSARWTIVTTPEMVLQFAREDVAVVRRIRVPTGRCALVVPLAVPESARWNARPVNGNELVPSSARGPRATRAIRAGRRSRLSACRSRAPWPPSPAASSPAPRPTAR